MNTNINPFPAPDICRNSSVLGVILAVELIAIVICLAFFDANFIVRLGIVSLYFQWWALISLLLLCKVKPVIETLPWLAGALATGALLFVPFVSVELVYQFYVAEFTEMGWFKAERFFANSLAAIILILVILRLMVLAAKVERWHQAEAESRIQALQARINPHFLFNSLNTISELAITDSTKADNAIQALSMLFRVSLEDSNNLHSLEKEIKLCERYVELEMWRVGELIEVDWNISVRDTKQVLVPKLIIQPLLENAIKYSSDCASVDHKAVVALSVKEMPNSISIKVVNPISNANPGANAGHGIAINNIRERLFVLYDDLHSFKIRNDSEQYQVLMTVPKQAVN